MVTLLLARQHPERVRRMVLMGSPGLGLRMTDGLRALRAYEPSVEAMRDLLRTHFAYDPDLVTEELVRTRYEASARPGEHENYRAIHKGQASPDNEPFTEELVRGIDVPALLVHGRDDRVLDAELSWRMAGLLPDAELHVFPRCGHWAQLEHAEAFNELVTGFFARDDERGPR
jgi:pimeloyl-ACP methyl ester carboxylesterase